ncbi:MAG TPA: TIGR03618 family F420-dependent PPOX class oxidoreductase [Thermomicrobiales bacterium]|jgi:PPOX class probable F420-dependent enzyme
MPVFTDRQRAFLDQPLNAVVATLRQDGVPSQSIVWYARDEGTLWISVRPESVKARHIAREPRLSVLIFSADGGSYLRLEGTATLEGEVDAAMRRSLISRYVGADQADAWIVGHPLASPNARLRIVPAHIAEHNIG